MKQRKQFFNKSFIYRDNRITKHNNVEQEEKMKSKIEMFNNCLGLLRNVVFNIIIICFALVFILYCISNFISSFKDSVQINISSIPEELKKKGYSEKIISNILTNNLLKITTAQKNIQIVNPENIKNKDTLVVNDVELYLKKGPNIQNYSFPFTPEDKPIFEFQDYKINLKPIFDRIRKTKWFREKYKFNFVEINIIKPKKEWVFNVIINKIISINIKWDNEKSFIELSEFISRYIQPDRLMLYYIQNKKFEDALNIGLQELQKNPNKKHIHNNIGIIYINMDQLEKAIYYLKLATVIDKYNFNSYYNLGQCYRIKFSRSEKEEKNDQFNKIIQSYKLAIEMKNDESDLYQNLGDLYLINHNYKLAIENFKKSVKYDPDNVEGYRKLGYSYIGAYYQNKTNKGFIIDSIHNLEKALTYNPENIEILRNLGKIYLENKETQKAIDKYEVVNKFKSSANSYFNLGVAYSVSMQHDKAIECYKKVISIQSDYTNVYNNLGVSYIVNKNYEKAIKAFKKAININPNDNDAKLNLRKALKLIEINNSNKD